MSERRSGELMLVPIVGFDHGALPLDRPLTIGRGDECDLEIPDPRLSRLHLRIAPLRDGVIIEDLGSRNGTFVDGRPQRRFEGAPPRLVRAGACLFRVVRSTEAWVAPRDHGGLVGGSSLEQVRRSIALIAPTDLPVLVLGETGTGKEVIARKLHDESGRRGAFVSVNCAALPLALAESELFGHTRAAFTGAGSARRGLFGAAAGGTLFLDEVGELPLETQAKLLRVLADGAVRPVGGEEAVRVDARVVAATHRDLRAQVEDGSFRLDLFARLAAVDIEPPPLRERIEDLPVLCDHLLARAGRGRATLTEDAIEALALYPWPMNVRELDHVLRIASLQTERIDLEHLPRIVQRVIEDARADASDDPSEPTRRHALQRALSEHGGNVRQAARALGMSRSHVYRLMEHLNLRPEDFRR